jgi:hypothetical protein
LALSLELYALSLKHYFCLLWTASSVGLERCLDKAEVTGSTPVQFTAPILIRAISSITRMKYSAKIICWCLFIFFNTSFYKIPCINGIYVSRQDFLENKISFPFNTPITFENIFRYEGNLQIIDSSGKKINFKPGKIFGFSNCSNKYIFDDYFWGRSYLTVVNETPVGIYISESYSKHNPLGFFRYSKKIGDPIKDFTKKNIQDDFSSDDVIKNKLINLLDKLPETFPAKSKDDIYKYEKIITEVMK